MSVPSKYELYLQSNDFDEKRQRIKKRDDYKCVVCGSKDNLQIHHLTYMHIYHENDDELVTVCRNCHRAFHYLNNMQMYIEERYRDEIILQREQESKERAEKYQEQQNQRVQIANQIMEEIKAEYAEKDYAKNGDLDMCSWSVLNPIIDAKCKQHNFNDYISKNDIRNWFLYRRYELLHRCILKGQGYAFVRDRTKFDPGWLSKWYNKEKIEAKLKEEAFINNIKEE